MSHAKTEATFREYRAKFIVPALDASERGIFIPYYTWLGEESSFTVDAKQVFTLGKITQIMDIYPKLRRQS